MARTFDEIVETLERDDRMCFTLDGQAILLEDYLAFRPEMEPRLRRLLGSGRLAVGPSYQLPDEFLVGGEMLVRNLLHGRRVCRLHGGRPMRVGYALDTFGRVGQLPQILRGFDLDTFFFMRGLGDEAQRLPAIFRWAGPDGSEVLAVRLMDGYGNFVNAGGWVYEETGNTDPARRPEIAARRVAEFTDTYRRRFERARLRDVLLCNGVDHRPIQQILPDLLDYAASRLPGARFRICTYEDYADRVREHAAGLAEPLPALAGELVKGREHTVTRGVNSARIQATKIPNAHAERELYLAETLAALAVLAGRFRYRYPARELQLACDVLMQCHPHDSIGGCSVDEVHADMQARFTRARRLAARVTREAASALAGHDEEWSYRPSAKPSYTVVNPLPYASTGLVDVAIPAALAGGRLVAELDGRAVAVQRAGRAGAPVGVLSVALAGFASLTLTLRRATAGAWRAAQPLRRAWSDDPRTIENALVRVRAADDGTLVVTDKATGETVAGILRFEDVGERGDLYNHCPTEDATIRSGERPAAARVVERGPHRATLQVRVTLRLPAAVGRDRAHRVARRVAVPVTIRVVLGAEARRVECDVTIRNAARDHRLRALFPCPGSTEHARAEGHFQVVRRDAQPTWNARW